METRQRAAETLAHTETHLAESRPFGDWSYIDERTWIHYDRRIEMLTEYLPGAQALLAAFRQASAQSRYQVMGDPVVRSAINTALGHFRLNEPHTPMDELEAILDIATSYLTEGKPSSPLEAGAQQAIRLGPASYHAWIWCDERSEDIPARFFRRLFRAQEQDRSALRTPDDHMQKMLVQGTHLLSELLPKLARSALNHVHLVAVVDVADRKQWHNKRRAFPFSSFTTQAIPGTIFLSPSVLTTPWQAAEYVLHEALHQKLYDLEHTHSLFRRGYRVADSPMIRPHWNRLHTQDSDEWPICRSLAACHVYVHLALFFTLVKRLAPELEQRYGSLGDLNPTISARRAFDRAHYLGHQLQQAMEELGVAGRHFVHWLFDILAMLDPTPPPVGAYVHLLLDLYDREAKEFGTLIAQASPTQVSDKPDTFITASDTLAQRIVPSLIQRELALANQVLFMCEGSDRPHPFATGAELAPAFQAARAHVSKSLRSLAPEDFNRSCRTEAAKTLGQLVREMVEYSGQQLNTLNMSQR